MKQSLRAALAGVVLAALGGGAAHALCGDLNNDGNVNGADSAILGQCAIGACPTLPPPGICGTGNVLSCGDIFADGVVDGFDVDPLNIFLTGGDPLYDICTGPGPNIACGGGTVTLGTPVPTAITSNQTWPANCTVVIGGTVTVETPAGMPTTVLRIAPGSIVKGATGTTTANPSSIIFQPGTHIDAVGSPGSPIVFGSNAAVGSRTKGDWGGVVFNGKGTVNGPNCFFQSEGLPFEFGGCEADYNAGIATFVRIEFAGLDFTENNELNLWTMNGLGTQTAFNFIQATVGDDDCLEWFGGTSNHNHMVASGCADDGFDYQLGFTGSIQYGVQFQNGDLTDTTPSRDSRGIEGDNSEFDPAATPFSNPSMCNLTLIGAKNQPGANVGSDSGILLRRGTNGQFANLIVEGYEDSCVELRDPATAKQACVDNNADGVPESLTGKLILRNSVLYDCGDTAVPATEIAKSGNLAGCPTGVAADCPCTTTAQWYGLLPNVVNADGVAPTVNPGISDQYPGIDNTGCTAAGTPYECCTGLNAGFCRAIPDVTPSFTGTPPSPFNCTTINPILENAGYLGAVNPAAVCTATSCDWMTKPWVEFAIE